MDFEQQKKKTSNEKKYHYENLKIAREFSKGLLTEMNDLVRSIVLFGSNTNDTIKKGSDIDIMIVLDNVSVFVSEELREAYRVITTKLSYELSDKLHIMTINLSDLWDMARKGDPVLINVLRHGMPIFDRDLVQPMQYLLESGRIKPSMEAIYNYKARSQTLLDETQKHLENAIMDLYYSLVDITHSILMTQKVMPVAPKEMPKEFKKVFKKNTKLLKHSQIIMDMYKIIKDIEHRKAGEIEGKLYDSLRKEVKSAVKDFSDFIDKEMKGADNFEF